jgi:hypothetical protein
MEQPLVAFTKFYISYHEAMEDLSDEQYGRVSRAINNYALYGKEPELTGVELIIFKMARPTIDSNVKSRTDGKKGGAPEGNTNAGRKQPENNPPCFGETTVVESGNNPPCFGETTKVNGNDNVNVKENGNGNIDFKNQKPPPQIIKNIISEAHRLGFIIDKKKAVEFYRSGIDPAWFEGPHSFLVLAAEKVTTAKYRDKPHDEQHNLFINAVAAWENLRLEYPSWLENRKREAAERIIREEQKKAEAEKETRIQKAREARPETCGCGKSLDETLSCLDCKVSYEFDENLLKYVPRSMSKFQIEYAMRKKGHGREKT